MDKATPRQHSCGLSFNESMMRLLYLAAIGAQTFNELEPMYSLEEFIDLVVRAFEGGIDDYYPLRAFGIAEQEKGAQEYSAERN